MADWTVLLKAKCPHDVVAADLDRIKMLPTPEGGFAIVNPPDLSFDCPECRAFSEGYLSAINSSSNMRSNTGGNFKLPTGPIGGSTDVGGGH